MVLKPGIWISPYVISEPTELFQKHPEWLLKKADGSLKRVGNWPEDAEPPADENPKRYCLDITHPGAAKWLHDLIDTIVNDWGYEMIKIDFMAWSILAADVIMIPRFHLHRFIAKDWKLCEVLPEINAIYLNADPVQ